jgi:hypothetical protein
MRSEEEKERRERETLVTSLVYSGGSCEKRKENSKTICE